MLLVVVHIELSLTKLLDYLANPLLSPRAFTLLRRIIKAREAAAGLKKMKDSYLANILILLDRTSNDYELKEICNFFENTDTGRNVKANYTDRHLYAVLQPSRSEILKRIENVLKAMSPADLRRSTGFLGGMHVPHAT